MLAAFFILRSALAAPSPAGGLEKASIKIDGRLRTFLLYLPETPPPADGYPVLFALHGGGGNARATANMSPFHQTGEARSWIVVYPQEVRKNWKSNWNDARVHTQTGKESYAAVDDVGFLMAALARLEADLAVDRTRIYATGVSNGAFMSQRLAAERADVFAAIAPVIGSMAESVAAEFSPAAPVSVLMINGTEDPLIPYEGGMATFGRTELGLALPVEEVVEKWVTLNRTEPFPQSDFLPDSSPDDGCRIERFVYAGGVNQTEVILLKAHGGGHNAPGDRQYAPVGLIGETCRDISATEYIAAFFAEQVKEN